MLDVILVPEEKLIYFLASDGTKKNFEWEDLLALKTHLNSLKENIGTIYLVQEYSHLTLSLYSILTKEHFRVKLVSLDSYSISKIRNLRETSHFLLDTNTLVWVQEIFENAKRKSSSYVPDYTIRNIARSSYKIYESMSQLGSSLRIVASQVFPYLYIVRPFQESFAEILNTWNDKACAIRDLAYTLLSYVWSEFVQLDLSVWEDFTPDKTFSILPITSALYYIYSKHIIPSVKFYALVDLWKWLQTFIDENTKEILDFSRKELGPQIVSCIQASKIDGIWPRQNGNDVLMLQKLATQFQDTFINYLRTEEVSLLYAESNERFKCIFSQLRHIFDIYSFTLIYSALDDPRKKFDSNVDRIIKYLDLYSNKPKVDGLNLAVHFTFRRKFPRLRQIFGDLPDELVLRKALQFLVTAWDDCQQPQLITQTKEEGLQL